MTFRGVLGPAAPVAAAPDLSQLHWATGILMAALLLGAIVIALVGRWRRRGGSGSSASDQLAEFRELYDEGVISKEEFRRRRARLGGQIRGASRAAKPGGVTETPPSAAPDPGARPAATEPPPD